MEYYTNPEIPDGLTDSEHGHGREFMAVCLKYLGLLVALLIVLDIAARLIVPLTPFSWEKKLTPDSLLKSLSASSTKSEAITRSLSELGLRVAANMDLPPDMDLTFHYIQDDTVNAMATLGGNILVFEGLLKVMPSEEALAAVMAHEIAHIKHRDMLKGLVRTVGLTIALALTGSDASALGEMGSGIGLLGYSRWQESDADEAAVHALGKMYGNIKGFEECFQALQKAYDGINPPEILSSHPDTEKRIRKARAKAEVLGYPLNKPTRALPKELLVK